MNKTIITLLLLIPVITFGQTKRKPIDIPFKHETTNWSDVTNFADKITSFPKRHYEITKIDSSGSDFSTVGRYDEKRFYFDESLI